MDGLAPVSGFGDQWLDIWGLKVVLDGGVEGGYFHDPYCNDSNFRGFPLTSQENLEAILEQASGLAWRVGIHVVGDAAMVMALDAFEATDARLSNSVRGHGLGTRLFASAWCHGAGQGRRDWNYPATRLGLQHGGQHANLLGRRSNV
ncbi:MAG TPA: hypothetical protein EYM65_11690 [Dehalococcoidia bacterium]|nr:hypothetical protein [Dehalococcoidia bacterium]